MKKWKGFTFALAMAIAMAVSGMGSLGGGAILGAQAPDLEEQKKMFSDGILDVDAYGYNVPDGYGWGPGADNIPMRCSLSGGGPDTGGSASQ